MHLKESEPPTCPNTLDPQLDAMDFDGAIELTCNIWAWHATETVRRSDVSLRYTDRQQATADYWASGAPPPAWSLDAGLHMHQSLLEGLFFGNATKGWVRAACRLLGTHACLVSVRPLIRAAPLLACDIRKRSAADGMNMSC